MSTWEHVMRFTKCKKALNDGALKLRLFGNSLSGELCDGEILHDLRVTRYFLG